MASQRLAESLGIGTKATDGTSVTWQMQGPWACPVGTTDETKLPGSGKEEGNALAFSFSFPPVLVSSGCHNGNVTASGLNHRHLFSWSWRLLKSKIKMLSRLVPSEASLWLANYLPSCNVFTWSFPCVCGERACTLVTSLPFL